MTTHLFLLTHSLLFLWNHLHFFITQGMVDPGELVTSTLKREFLEETLNSGHQLSEEEKDALHTRLTSWMSSERAKIIYKGLVENDPRNTDNAWMETVVSHFHDERGDTFASLALRAGDDAREVKWMDVSNQLDLYADHKHFIHLVAQQTDCHW